jgi:hypothetical protein
VRFMIVARPRTGMSCLAVRLLHDGADVEGDALAVLADGHVTAFPRPFYLGDGARAVVPELAARFHELPSLANHGGTRTWAYHPDTVGRPWRITTAPVDVVVQLEPYHGASTRLAPVPGHAMARIVTSCAMPRPEAGEEVVRAVAQLLRGPQAVQLRLGALEDGVVALRRLVC